MARNIAATVRAIEEAWDRGQLDQLDQYFPRILTIPGHRLEDGKVVEHQGLDNGLSLLMQLGAIPAPS